MTTYGFLGLGAMGAPMASNLAAAATAGGDGLIVWNRSAGRDAGPRAHGARRASSAAEVLARAEIVVAMLPDLPQLLALTDGPESLLASVTDRTVLVVCSSVSPDGVRDYAAKAAAMTSGLVGVVDAPVSGGPEGAEAASLAIMVGGADADVAAAWPVLTAMGKTVRHLGAVGAGSVAKVCNQMVVAATMIALSEASTLAEAGGLDVAAMLDVLGAGYAASRLLDVKRRNLTAIQYPLGSRASYMIKDLDFVKAEASRTGVPTPQADVSRGLFAAVVRAGMGAQDMSVVHRLVRGSAGLG